MKTKLIFIFSFVILSSFMDKPAYKIYDKSGNQSSYENMLLECENADIILFGELHNNPICHWLQLELTKDMFAKKGKDLVLGAEMFESDNQLLIDEYFEGFITENKFENEMRMWDNYYTDYKPLVVFAKNKDLKFVATNIPRRYANTVYKQGIESLKMLSKEAKKYIAPLPVKIDLELNCYKQLSEVMAHMGANAGINMANAQAIKDATMAHFILKNYKKGNTFIHFNGTYHSNNYESIYWFLKQKKQKLKIVTIATANQIDIDKLDEENIDVADFIITTPETMTGTY